MEDSRTHVCSLFAGPAAGGRAEALEEAFSSYAVPTLGLALPLLLAGGGPWGGPLRPLMSARPAGQCNSRSSTTLAEVVAKTGDCQETELTGSGLFCTGSSSASAAAMSAVCLVGLQEVVRALRVRLRLRLLRALVDGALSPDERAGLGLLQAGLAATAAAWRRAARAAARAARSESAIQGGRRSNVLTIARPIKLPS